LKKNRKLWCLKNDFASLQTHTFILTLIKRNKKSKLCSMKIILFVCKGNSGRSQMAEAFLNHFCKSVKALSAGVEPDEKIHPWTIQVMQEV